MGLTRTQDPAIEPVDLATAKLQLRVIDTAEDALITMLIAAARRYAEGYCNRSFITQKWRLTLDRFPPVVKLERGPVQSVDSIVYVDMSGSTQTVTAPALPNYAIDLSGPFARMAPGFGRIWPIPLPQLAAVQINFTAGYGPAATDVPEGIRQWILMRVNTLYENREEVGGKVEAIPYLDRLLDDYVCAQA